MGNNDLKIREVGRGVGGVCGGKKSPVQRPADVGKSVGAGKEVNSRFISEGIIHGAERTELAVVRTAWSEGDLSRKYDMSASSIRPLASQTPPLPHHPHPRTSTRPP